MQTMILAKLRAAFVEFRANPAYQLMVEIRRYRAAQLRQLLADPATITVATFNREVWPLESETRVNGASIKLTALDSDPARLAAVRQALCDGKLEIHGNGIWGSATRIFGSQIAQQGEHLPLLQAALRLLNDATLPPFEKATKLQGIKGFGPNSATGLVMVFHPDSFALCNEPSQTALEALGYSIPPHELLTSFEAAAHEVRHVLGAADFLELDYFLYLLSKRVFAVPRVWWVNQGESYDTDSLERRLWTPKKDKRGSLPEHWRRMQDMRPGDYTIHYSHKAIRASGIVLGEAIADESGWAVPVNYLPLDQPISLTDIPTRLKERTSTSPFNVNQGIVQGYLYLVPPEYLDFLASVAVPELTASAMPFAAPPTLADLRDRTGLDGSEIEVIRDLLEKKRQLIFSGPPGTGKTYIADLFARYFAGVPLDGRDDERVRIVQFHQSFSYEDFMQGIRPETNDAGQIVYTVRPGIFLQLCEQARRNPEHRFMLIIDEINRGDLSRILGELLMLLEYRQRDGDGANAKSVRLPYGRPDDPPFTIPANIYLIGTMNTADRSLAPIDYALRRRFYFYPLRPVRGNDAPVLRHWLEREKWPVAAIERVVRLFVALNQRLSAEMGEDFAVGHSYLMDLTRPDPDAPERLDAELDRVWRYGVMPLLTEYFYHQRDRAAALAKFALPALLPSAIPVVAGEAEA